MINGNNFNPLGTHACVVTVFKTMLQVYFSLVMVGLVLYTWVAI